MNDNITPVYPVYLPYRQGCWIPPKYAEDCEYYDIDHDMGASNPYCLKLHTTYPNNCSEKCPYYRNKYEQLISRTETEPYKYED